MPVSQSSHLQAWEYEPNSQTLTVQFQNSAVYQYSGVPQTVVDAFAQSGGSGTYFHAKINQQYHTTKLTGGDSHKGRR
jgi:protein involved in polysaccharide export with SLBB domain